MSETKDPADPLVVEPQRFDFFQAVRRIEGRSARQIQPVGTGSDVAREAVRFRSNPSGAFPESDIAGYAAGEGKTRASLTVNFLNLAGSFGPLPPPMAEHIARRRRMRGEEADAAGDFIDIFNHRLISLFVRVRRSHRLALQPGAPDETEFGRVLQALLGIGMKPLRYDSKSEAHGLDRGLLQLAGLLNENPVSLHAVERAASHLLGVPVRGTPFQGAWLDIPPESQTRLAHANNRLGIDAILGRRAWCQSAGIRLMLGPLTLDQYEACLPEGAIHKSLRRLLAFLLGGEVAVDLCLWLKTTVGAARTMLGAARFRLGWGSWILGGAAAMPFEAFVPLHLGEITDDKGTCGA